MSAEGLSALVDAELAKEESQGKTATEVAQAALAAVGKSKTAREEAILEGVRSRVRQRRRVRRTSAARKEGELRAMLASMSPEERAELLEGGEDKAA